MNEQTRYSRQSLLPPIGSAGQRRIGHSRVLCVGAGGLGCAVLPYLAGAGVGHITVIDADRVDVSNLQRQVLFTEADTGQPKAERAAAHLADLNSEITVRAMTERLDAGNIQRLFEDHDVIVDGSDNFDTKFLIGDASLKFGVPVVYGSTVGLEAQVTVLDPDRGPCLRCLFPHPPDGWVPNCAEAGVLGPLVGIAGAVQATETLKLLACDGQTSELEPLIGRLWTLDARDMRVRALRFERREACPACRADPSSISLPDAPRDGGISLAPATAAALEDVCFVDVREPDEWRRNRIPGAVNLPLSRLMAGQQPEAEGDGTLVVYCERGPRGEAAARLLQQAGFGKVRNLGGGIAAWPGARETD
jgi:adenylyltransferase/sulfurtransferase